MDFSPPAAVAFLKKIARRGHAVERLRASRASAGYEICSRVQRMPQTFDFFYDLGSPYSYLASTQLAGIEQRTGANARLLPITLGGLRKATGHQLPPPQQLKYMSEDTSRWARQYGVPMRIPKAFPISTILPLRAC